MRRVLFAATAVASTMVQQSGGVVVPAYQLSAEEHQEEIESELDGALLELLNDDETKSAETVPRDLDVDLPSDVSICDEYFFGRQTKLPSNQQPFCVNGGFCKASWVRDPAAPCECLSAYDGPHCEFDAGTLPDTCHLGCRNGGECKIGAPTWQHFYRGKGSWTNPLDLQHCECPENFTGLLCELRGSPCGESRCHNGGTCIQTNQPDGSNKHFCDCSTAKSSDGIKAFAGDYCEHEATSYCTEKADQNGHQFCVNGGTCKGESHLGCHCQEGFVGPVCEFEDRGEPPAECNLTCENHGLCRKGAKDVSSLEKFGIDDNHNRRNLQKAYNEDFEHCVCPRGYVGLQCEYQLDICPGGAHACLNGGDCLTVPNGAEVQYGCDCTNAETGLTRFAGSSCEMESTQFCTVDGTKSRSGPGLNSFCTNGGLCRGFVSFLHEHPGCDCPNGFEGENCQYRGEPTGSPNTSLIVAGVIVASSILIVIVLFRLKKWQSEKRLYDNVIKRGGHGMPPTLNIIAAALGHDREAEFTEGTDTLSYHDAAGPSRFSRRSTSVSVRNTEDLVYMRKTNWPNNSSTDCNVSDPIHIFNDAVEMDEDQIRESRKTYWPNDAHNDASNPIQIFDDISVDTRSSMGSDENKSGDKRSDNSSSSSSGSDNGNTGIV